MQRFCPVDAEAACRPPYEPVPGATCRGRPLWLGISAMALASPVALALLGRWLQPAQALSVAEEGTRGDEEQRVLGGGAADAFVAPKTAEEEMRVRLLDANALEEE